MKKCITFVGLDVHKNSISVALAETGREQEVRRYGTIEGDMAAVDKLTRKLISKNYDMKFVYEAGPCGYELYRHLTNQGYDCTVVAPSMIPKKSGDRIKNDTRDAEMLARLHRSGELTSVYVPDREDEAMRDLTRAREDAKIAERKSKQLLSAFLLRHGLRYSGRQPWTIAYFRWIADIKLPHPAQQIVLQQYLDTIRDCSQRVGQLTEQIHQLLPLWKLAPVVQALQAMRGVSLVVAATTIAELGDIKNRFNNPRQLMAYLGLVPSEHSSGGKIRKGSITKTGNSHVRRVLTEAAWAYRLPARVSSKLFERQQGLSKTVLNISWKAQQRLCARYRRLVAKGKNPKTVITALARELCAFMWAIAQEVSLATK